MNTFGRSFRCTTFGESHGKAMGVVIDGCPPGIELSESDIQPLLDRRRPGRSDLSSPRKEPDRVEILSGTFQGRTTGAPIALVIRNVEFRSADYDHIAGIYRPGHADYTWQKKYGIRDHRGGGRSSGRETVARVAAGAVAMRCLSRYGIAIDSTIIEIHGKTIPCDMEDEIKKAIAAGDSVGGVVGIRACNCPPGLGDPVFGKLDALIAHAMMSIGAVKGVEIGDGFTVAEMYGSEQNDQMGEGGFLSNHAGGILGGISNGCDIVVRIAVKPTPSISSPQKTLDINGRETEIMIEGRHDPCIVPRIAPVAESMLALVLMDSLLEQEKYAGFSAPV